MVAVGLTVTWDNDRGSYFFCFLVYYCGAVKFVVVACSPLDLIVMLPVVCHLPKLCTS